MIFFTDFKVAALVSLLVAESVIVGAWVFYARKFRVVTHPYPREDVLDYVRYIFDSPTSVTYDVTEVFRVTEPMIDHVPIKLTWSGRGSIRVSSELVGSEIQPSIDGQTGKISFNFPLLEPKRFGDVVIVHYRLELTDDSKQNVPQLTKNTRRPCQMIVSSARRPQASR